MPFRESCAGYALSRHNGSQEDGWHHVKIFNFCYIHLSSHRGESGQVGAPWMKVLRLRAWSLSDLLPNTASLIPETPFLGGPHWKPEMA